MPTANPIDDAASPVGDEQRAAGVDRERERMEALIRASGRIPRQRTTLYEDAPAERRRASFGAPPLAEPLDAPVQDARLKAPPRLVRPGFATART